MLIVGAGVCGIALGDRLGRLGIPYTIVERNAEVGGTWYKNRYPGCGVDTPNHSYSFSFGARNRMEALLFRRATKCRITCARVAIESGVRKHPFRLRSERRAMERRKRRWISTLEPRQRRRVLRVEGPGPRDWPVRATLRSPDSRATEEFRGPMFHSAAGPTNSSSTASTSP